MAGLAASRLPPELYQYDDWPVCSWKVTNDCGNDPQLAAFAVDCGVPLVVTATPR